MSQPISNITLEFPCRENWDQMEVVPGGKLCTACACVVKDFRDCSKEDLTHALRTQSHVCGIFNRNQLSQTFLKAAAIALATTTVSACNTEQLTPATQDAVTPSLSVDLEDPNFGLDSRDTIAMMGLMFTPLPDSTDAIDINE
jgi:hypothetical protein